MPASRPSPLPAIRSLHKGRTRWWTIVPCGLGLSLLASAAAGTESLSDLLRGAAEGTRYETPTRADLDVECTPACTTRRAILLGRGDTVYVETRDGQRALIRPDRLDVARDGKATSASPDATFGDTTLLLRDLAVFSPAALALPQISDDGPDGIVVTSAPTGRSPYTLLVLTIDRTRRAIVKTQYYTESIGHLAKIRRDRDFVRVGAVWRPTVLTVERFEPGATTRMRLVWREAPETPPTVFDTTILASPSTLEWPD